MARKPKPAEQGAIRFVADYDYIDGLKTTAFKKGMVIEDPSAAVRKAALGSGKAVDGNGEG